ncbi:ABC-2 transporter permease [Cohnella caldifontis]|uniref:ABC-2 transporter permease n=1 Tax=Cohnella caldifontis TaxID=3027471 RepID=UPI0023EBA3D5|nr:ABC-2 transporter permease [Cohnella sp. YIM B05605]
MYNLVIKDLKLSIHFMFLVMPFLFGALMLVPGWIYFIVPLYFCWITVPNVFGQLRVNNDLMMTSMMPVTKQDIVKARITVIAGLELLHIVAAMIFGLITIRLYPDLTYYFYPPNMGFWGLCFVMMAIFNLVFIPMYYRTAYKFGGATIAAIAAAMLFAGIAQWLGIQSPLMSDLFYGTDVQHRVWQTFILIAGIVIFVGFAIIAYRMAIKRFLKVEIQ